MHIRTTPRCLGCCNNSKSRVGCSILKRNQPRKSLTKPTQLNLKISYDSALYATQTHQFTTCTRLSKHLELPVLKCVRSSIMLINASRCMLLPSSMHTGIWIGSNWLLPSTVSLTEFNPQFVMPICIFSIHIQFLISTCMWVMKRLPNLRSPNVKSVLKNVGYASYCAKGSWKCRQNVLNLRWSTCLGNFHHGQRKVVNILINY